jgi:hypothetical protein
VKRRLACLLWQERALALPMAIGIILVLAIVSTALVEYSVSNSHSADRSKQVVSTYELAQSGIDAAAAQLANAPTAIGTSGSNSDANYFTNTCAIPANCTLTTNGGTVIWTGTLATDASNPVLTKYVWHITSTATMANPAAPGSNVTRTVRADIPMKAVKYQTQPPGPSAWDYIYSWAPPGAAGTDPCTNGAATIANNQTIYASMYYAGDACMSNNTQIEGPTASLNIQGRLSMTSPQNSIGQTSLLASVYITGNPAASQVCTSKSNGSWHSPCGSGDKVYPTSVSPGPVVAKPTVDFTHWYQAASPGPLNPCDPSRSTGTLPVFDTDMTPNGSLGGFSLTPTSAYDCKTPDGGELMWTPGSPGQLYINGTVFFDGSATLSGNLKYSGWGTIYLNGSITLQQDVVCAVYSGSNCNWAGWNPNTNGDLTIVANASSSIDQSSYQGQMYVNGDVSVTNSSYEGGPIIASHVNFGNQTFTQYFPAGVNLPSGAPGAVVSNLTVRPPTNYSG